MPYFIDYARHYRRRYHALRHFHAISHGQDYYAYRTTLPPSMPPQTPFCRACRFDAVIRSALLMRERACYDARDKRVARYARW